MASLLEMIIAFVGIILILALAAQSLQELVKHTFAIKGYTRVTALRRLVVEAAKMQGMLETDGKQIATQVLERLENLGQNGVRTGKVRLDRLEVPELKDLICHAKSVDITALKGFSKAEARARLEEVADQAATWYPLALGPVDSRYARRMRLSALLSALVVVVAVNADAFSLWETARTDPGFRERVAAATEDVTSADSSFRSMRDSAITLLQVQRTASDTTAALDSVRLAQVTPVVLAMNEAWQRRDSVLIASMTESDLFAFGGQDWSDPAWWLGIFVSTLLVGLGAPFWHDILETVLGWKVGLRKRSETASQPAPVTPSVSPQTVPAEIVKARQAVRDRREAGGAEHPETEPAP